MSTAERERERGFELGGEFYRWSVTLQGKDLMLIDHFTQMPIPEFLEEIEDGFDRGRAPLLLAMVATSIRAGHPEWTRQRIVALVERTELTSIEFLDGEVDEDELRPPPQRPEPSAERGASPSNGSSSSPTPEGSSTSQTSSESPA